MKNIIFFAVIIIMVMVLSWVSYILLTGTTGGDMAIKMINGQEESLPYREIVDPAGYINTDKVSIGELVGKKVILVDFMTYSCINCIRTFPYLNQWYQTYRDQGLEIVGIHTPEFAFEHKIDNVRQALTGYGIKFPVVLDNNYSTWRNYSNNYWPRKYLIDIHGNIVYDHIGEGAYDETEMKIRELLAERQTLLGLTSDMPATTTPITVDMDLRLVGSPEVYFGSERNEFLVNGKRRVEGEQSFTRPTNLQLNGLALVGNWDVKSDFIKAATSTGSILFHFQSRDVYMVAATAQPARVQIYLDGKLLTGPERGIDVGEDGTALIGGSRLYHLIHSADYGEHLLEIVPLDEGVEFYTLTFG